MRFFPEPVRRTHIPFHTEQLPAVDWELRLENDPAGWCSCILVTPSGERLLGGDADYIVVDRLLRAVRDAPSREPGPQLEGRPVTHALSLSAPHADLYVCQEGETLWMHWQDSKGLTRLGLNQASRRDWCRRLQTLLAEPG